MSENQKTLPEIQLVPLLPILNPWRERIEQARSRCGWALYREGRFLKADKVLAERWESCATSYYPFEKHKDGETPGSEHINQLGMDFYRAARGDRVEDAARLLEEIERQGALLQSR